MNEENYQVHSLRAIRIQHYYNNNIQQANLLVQHNTIVFCVKLTIITIFITSFYSAVFFKMSWIEKPANEIVRGFNLSTLGIDEAFLNVSSSLSQNIWLYELSSNCFKCPFRLLSEIRQGDQFDRRISTRFPVTYRLRTSDIPQEIAKDNDSSVFCDVNYEYGEFGYYDLHISEDSNNSPKCEIDVVAEPVNIYYPLLLVALFYILLFAVVYFISFLNKIRLKKSIPQQHTPSSPTSETSISTNTSGTNGKTNDSQSEKTPITSNTTTAQVNQSQNSRTNPATATQRQKQRLKSLDTFRGICIVVMIFVNDGGAYYYFFEHATWDGLYVADLVFPWFLWIMGVCIPIAIKSQVKRGVPKSEIFSNIAIRSLKLIIIGVILNSRGGPGPIQFGENANLRIPGILQRFGVSYFVCASLVLFSMTVNITKPESSKLKAMLQDIWILGVSWIVVLLIVLVHCLITFCLPVPGCPTGYLGPAGLHDNNFAPKECIGGAAGYLDRKIFTTKHIYQYPTAKSEYLSDVYDPEGFLGTLMSIFQVWFGVQTGATMLVFPRARSRLIRWGIWATFTGVLGAVLCGGQESDWWIPLNKNLWSISFVFVTTSFSLILLSVLYIVVDLKRFWSGSPFFEPGMNSILLYVGHSIFYTALPWHWSAGLMNTHFIRLCESLWGTSLWVLTAMWLHHKKRYWSL